MSCRHIGHFFNECPHGTQVAKCPHGMHARHLSSSMHNAQVFVRAFVPVFMDFKALLSGDEFDSFIFCVTIVVVFLGFDSLLDDCDDGNVPVSEAFDEFLACPIGDDEADGNATAACKQLLYCRYTLRRFSETYSLVLSHESVAFARWA